MCNRAVTPRRPAVTTPRLHPGLCQLNPSDTLDTPTTEETPLTYFLRRSFVIYLPASLILLAIALLAPIQHPHPALILVGSAVAVIVVLDYYSIWTKA